MSENINESKNTSLRVKFVRGDEVKYISHLDLMKTFERSIRRARIPIAFSQGFNPHPMMVFGLPLSVGVTSESEYADFELSFPMEPKEFMEKLNESLPGGLKIIDAALKTDRSNIMAQITKGAYKVIVDIKDWQDGNNLDKMIEDFMASPSIVIEKEGKNGVRSVDIRSSIYQLKFDKFIDTGNNDKKRAVFDMLLGAGSVNNLKPEFVISALSRMYSTEMVVKSIHRTGLFVGTESETGGPIK